MKNKEINQRELEELTRDYFIKQKIFEVSMFIIILLAFIFIPFLLGNNIGDDEYCYDDSGVCSPLELWARGFLYILIGLMIGIGVGLGVYFIIIIIGDWIKSNWDKAERRAREDLK